MKTSILFLFLFANLALADLAVEETKNTGPLSSYVKNEDTQFKMILEIPEVKDIYDLCMKTEGITPINLQACLLDGKVDGNIVGEGISNKQDIMTQIQEIMSKPVTSKANSDKKGYDSFETLTSNINMNDPAFLELHKYMSKKLEEALYGEIKEDNPERRMVDHVNFNYIYKGQVSNNIILALSSYCIKADSNKGYFLSEDEKVIEDNMSKLTKESTDQEGNPTTIAANDYATCIKVIPQICYDNEYGVIIGSDKEAKKVGPSGTQKDAACLVSNYLRKARQQLLAISTIDEQYQNIAKDQQKNSAAVQGQVIDQSGRVTNKQIETYTGDKNKKQMTMEEIVSISSKEALTDSGFDKKNEEMLASYEACLKDDKIVDPEACKKYLGVNVEDQMEILAENILRQEGMKARIKTEVASDDADENSVISYLVDEGYSEKEARELAENDLDKIKKEILDRYENEKGAIINDMAAKISGTTSRSTDTIEGDDDSKTLKSIQDSLTSRTENLKQLLHYNNIVSSYLSVENDSGEKRKNTIAFDKEISNSSYEEDNEERMEELRKLHPQDGRTPSSNDKSAGASSFSVNTINEVLRYFSAPKKEVKD